jgi:HNH endonuclease
MAARITPPIVRFWKHVDRGDPRECWCWIGATTPDGYGQFFLAHGRCVLAHRFLYEHVYGPIPAGKLICHDCPTGDNPACVNPAHLFLGTNTENIHDAIRKGTFHRGERSPRSRLTTAQVLAIRATDCSIPGTKTRLAREYGVKTSSIIAVLTRRSWKHL